MQNEPIIYPLRIAGLGAYLPEKRVSSAELEARLDIPAGWIERATGVQERRVVTHETSAGMGAAAAQAALSHARIEAGEIDLIIGASTAPQQAIPCTAALVQRELKIASSLAPCFDINATCLSFLFALQTAALFLQAGIYRNILIFSSEIASISLNWEERESASLFGDGAAAVVVTRSLPEQNSSLWRAQFQTDSQGADFTRFEGAGTLHHPNNPTTTAQMNTFSMQGPAIFKAATRLMPPFLEEFFTHVRWDKSTIDAVVPHQASLPAIHQLTRRFGFSPEQVIVNLPLRGNCIAASIPLALTEAVHAGRIERGQRVLLLGSGAGLSLGAVALTF